MEKLKDQAWNDSVSFRNILESRANLLGTKPFCQFEGETWSFGDFRSAVISLAAGLAGRGVGLGSVVGVMLPSHPDHITVIGALNLLGAIHMPINVHHAFHGLQNQLQHARPELLIAEETHRAVIASVLPTLDHPPQLVWRGQGSKADGFDGLHSRGASSLSLPPDDVDRTAMLTYTSGTTGAPKGALLSGRYLTIGARNAAILSDLSQDDVLFLWEPFYHMAGWISVLAALRGGVPLGMVERFSASRCWDQIRHYGATKFHYIGSVVNILLRQDPRPNDADNPVTIAWGGGAPGASWAEFQRRFAVQIREGYGLSEAGNFVSLNIGGPTGSVGKPCAECDIVICRPDGSKADTNELGQIVVRPKRQGVTMAGYYRDPEKTKEVLRHDGVHTGDLGFLDEQGWLFFAGRLKDSLRRRGENISAWEIERVVAEHPEIEDCAVIGVPSELGEDEIKLFVKLAEGSSLTEPSIYLWSQAKLARFQVPRFIQLVPEFPRGPTQRIKKSDIPNLPSWDAEVAYPRTAAR